MLQGGARERAPDTFQAMLLQQEPQLLLRYWKRSTSIDHTYTTDLTSGWYTLIYLRWRAIYGAGLNFEDPLHRRRGATVLSILLEHAGDKSFSDSLLAARNWMDDTKDDKLPPIHHLQRSDFIALNGISNPFALFLLPDNESLASGHMSSWVPMIKHSLQPHGNGSISMSNLLLIAKTGELAMVQGQRYYPLPPLCDEVNHCTVAVTNLAFSIWDAIHETLSVVSPSLPIGEYAHPNPPRCRKAAMSPLSPLARCWFPSASSQVACPILPDKNDLVSSFPSSTSRCYGTSLDGTTRLALGHAPTDTLSHLLQTLQDVPQDRATETLRSALLQPDTQLSLCIWKRLL